MKILLTGGAGFLGSHLVEHFLKNTDATIIVLDKLSYASNGFDRLRDINAYDEKRVIKLNTDLSQPIPEGIAQEIGEVHYVIHAAAESHVDNSIVDPVPFINSNVLGTHHLLWWARNIPTIRRIFLVSTDEVYGPAKFGDDVAGFDEKAQFRPANPYAAAKAGGEAIGMAYSNTYKLPITIVNTMNLIGERQGAEKYVPMVIRKVIEGEKVFIHSNSTKTLSGTRFYIHCRNYANALHFLINKCELRWNEKYLPIKIHVCGEREISNLSLAQMIAGFVGKPLNYELIDFHSSRPGHDLRYAMSAELIKKLGWKQPFDIEQSLEKTVRWYLKEENKRWLYSGIKK